MVKTINWQYHLVIRMIKFFMLILEIFPVQHELILYKSVFKELCNMDNIRLCDCLSLSLSEDNMLGKNVGFLGYDR